MSDSPKRPLQDANEQTGIDMLNARSSSGLNTEDIRVFLHYGKQKWETRRKIVDILEKDPVFEKSKRMFLTRTESYENSLALTNRIFELQVKHGWSEQETGVALSSVDQPLSIQLHNVAFQPVFQLQAGPSLLQKYGALIAARAIIGCYLQTELGHGTNVSRLETTATYMKETQEFEIHSPTLTSSKWWVGALGKTATHGVVQAKLVLAGKDIGPHLFFVQLRSLENHNVMPGITIGDIGPKVMGAFPATDNGYARFDRVRIPKENMLSGFAQVTDDGRYLQPPHAKISYGGMLYIRSTMVTTAGWVIAKAATISVRYATVRRQGEIGLDGLEKQIISYPSVYYRLLPILSRAYTFIQLGRNLTVAFESMANRLKKGDTSLLGELHATTSGLKVLVTTAGAQDVEVARRALGGHGFSAFSGFGALYANYLPAATYEGDNYVLDQQVVRAALKAYKRFSEQPSDDLLSPSSHYLRHLNAGTILVSQAISENSWRDPATSILLLERRAALMVQDYAKSQTLKSSGMKIDGQSELGDANVNHRLSRAITESFVGVEVGKVIASLGNQQLNKRDNIALGKLFLLYLLTTTENALMDLLSFGLIPPITAAETGPIETLRHTINAICRELLPDAIGLTDAFGFTDWELDSALGVYNGKVYEALWESAKREPLNAQEVTDAYETSIKPILKRGLDIVERKYSRTAKL